MKSTAAGALPMTDLAQSEERSDPGREGRTTPALTVTRLAERDEHGGTGRGVTMYNEAGSTAAKPH